MKTCNDPTVRRLLGVESGGPWDSMIFGRRDVRLAATLNQNGIVTAGTVHPVHDTVTRLRQLLENTE
ncbi:MAG: hypothetical protein M3Y72_27145 [Acidobacteriota bacterium]|nr:hypothetical protein [Acidobacteriota bacterium]